MISLHCDLGSCPSGPTAGMNIQQWMLADGRLIQSETWPLDRHGTVDHVKLYVWSRDADLHDVFGSPFARGISREAAIRWLTEQSAVECAGDWTVTFLRVPYIGCALYEYEKRSMRAWICAWYDLRGIDMPVPRYTHIDPPKVTSRIVRGQKSRRRARRRVNS